MAEKKKVTYYLGTGRRKTAVARVRVIEGKGQILINERPLPEYFTEEKDRAAVMGPLAITEQGNRLDVIVRVNGGGITGQAGAISQGVARALKTMFSPKGEQRVITRNHVTMVKSFKAQTKDVPTAPKPATAAPAVVKPTANPDGTPVIVAPEDPAAGMVKKLRESGFLTRDSRMKERKKYGLRGARRGTQFSKR
jgi:small subunit ribosomal protein S9